MNCNIFCLNPLETTITTFGCFPVLINFLFHHYNFVGQKLGSVINLFCSLRFFTLNFSQVRVQFLSFFFVFCFFNCSQNRVEAIVFINYITVLVEFLIVPAAYLIGKLHFIETNESHNFFSASRIILLLIFSFSDFRKPQNELCIGIIKQFFEKQLQLSFL